jgi:hypothetical protein
MNSVMLNFILTAALPGIIFPLLMALVAILGVARWPRTLLVLALVALALRVLGVVISVVITHFLLVGIGGLLPIPVVEFLVVIGSPIINLSISVETVGVFLALVLAARARSWYWFVTILLATIISALGANFAFSIYGLRVFLGTVSGAQQVSQIYLNPWYIVVANVIAGLNILAVLLYALLGQRETPVAPDAG